MPTAGKGGAARAAWHCWAKEEPGRTGWRRWWMTGCCWSPAGRGRGCDPGKRRRQEKTKKVVSSGEMLGPPS